MPASPEAAAKNRARSLICHGALDPFTQPEAIAAFKKSLDDGKFDYQFVTYSGALHAFTNPDADGIAAATRLQGIAYNEPAARRSCGSSSTRSSPRSETPGAAAARAFRLADGKI